MNKRIKELAEQSTTIEYGVDNGFDRVTFDKEKFAELIVAEAFRAGILYSAKKYAAVGNDRFTGNDVSMFLEMEADELSDDEIKTTFRS